MNRKILSYSVGAAAVLFGLAACSSDNTTSGNGTPTSAEVTASARQGAGEGAAMTIKELDDNEAAYGAANDVSNGSANVVAPTTVNCSGPDSNGWYNCVAVVDSGVHVTITRSIRFWSGTNYDLWWNNPSPTDSVNHKWTADGTLNSAVRNGRDVTVDDSSAASLVVVRSAGDGAPPVARPQHVWTGEAAQHHVATWSENNVERILTMTGYDTVSAVTFQNAALGESVPAVGFDHDQHDREFRGRQLHADRHAPLDRDVQRHEHRDAAGWRGDLRLGPGYARGFELPLVPMH